MNAHIERIVVPLDAASESRTAIETAARLAARSQAKLHGIFIEDEDLLHLANLPFVRQVTLHTGSETFDREQIERQWRAAAARARADLSVAAAQHGVAWSFETVRGTAPGALSGLSPSDLVVASGLTRPIAGHFRVECRWWSSMDSAPCGFLLTRRAWAAGGAVAIVLRDRSAGAARLLDAAGALAEARGGVLTVICDAELAAVDVADWIAERLASYAVEVRVETAPAESAALPARVAALDCECLAIDAGPSEARSDRLRALFGRIACDLLVVG